MTVRSSRRSFLRTASFLAAGALGGFSAAVAPNACPAIEPIRRPGAAKFKFSLAGYSYRHLLTGNPPKLTLEDFFADCAAMGLEGAEPTAYYFPRNVTPEFLRRLKHLAFRLGLDISGTAVGNDFCHPPGPKRDEQLAMVKRWIEYAEILGAPVIRIFSGSPKAGQSVDQAHRLAVEGIEECCEHAGRHGVFLALENHGGLTATADGMLRLVRDVKSPWFGVNLDSGNFQGEDPYAELDKIAPYALNVQIKVTVSGPGGKRRKSDYARLKKMLVEAGYRGYIVLEYEEDEDPRTACPRHMDEIRRAFG
jgi:sugar phosphate isomerase/epimerase